MQTIRLGILFNSFVGISGAEYLVDYIVNWVKFLDKITSDEFVNTFKHSQTPFAFNHELCRCESVNTLDDEI